MLIINTMYNQNSNNLRAYNDFMTNYKVDSASKNYTHVSLGPPWGKFNIPDHKLDEFMFLYESCVGYSALYLAEKPNAISPLNIDIDFDMDENKRQYTYGDIGNIIELTNNIIKKKVVIENDTLLAHVLEKSEQDITEKGTIQTIFYRDGIHIIYPYFMTTQDVKLEIIKELQQECIKYNIFEYFKLRNTIDKVIDIYVANTNTLLMYGSQKYGGPLYKLSKIYNDNLLNIFDGGNEPLRDHAYLVNKLSNRKYKDYNVSPIKKEMVNIINWDNNYGRNVTNYNYNDNYYDNYNNCNDNEPNGYDYNCDPNDYVYREGEYEHYERIANGYDENNFDNNNFDNNNYDGNENNDDENNNDGGNNDDNENNNGDNDNNDNEEDDNEEDNEEDECDDDDNNNSSSVETTVETTVKITGATSSKKSLVFKNCKNCKFYIY